MDLATIALLMYGVPYTFGGNDITTGLDCSGMTCEALRSVGKLDSKDYSAQMLYDKFYKTSKSGRVNRNTILFFGSSVDSVSHVAIALNDTQMIEAGGEGRVETDKGYVRIRPISNRRDFLVGVNL